MIDGIKPPRRPLTNGNQPPVRPSQPLQPQQPPRPAITPLDSALQQKIDIPATDNPVRNRKSRSPFGWWKRLGKKQQIIILITVSVFLLGGGGAAAYTLTRHPKPTPPPPVARVEEKPVEPPKPTTLPSPLTGVQVAPEVAQMPVTGVMIENSPDARPQSGLKDAGIVYEAIAEGGITRFLALFQESQPDYVGPVRSVRPYYLEWVQGYDAAIAHVGGSPEALQLIKSAGVKDLDQFYNSGPYHRVSTRYAPHNMYTGIPALVDLEKSKGFTKSNFTGFSRKADKPSATPNAKSIDFTMSGFLYNPHFDYKADTNSYLRSQAGKPHLDEKSKEQLNPKVVVALVIPYNLESDNLHSEYQTTGSGKTYIFQDGTVTEGTWSKADSKASLQLGDANGSPIALNAGQTWITAVGTAGSVAYK